MANSLENPAKELKFMFNVKFLQEESTSLYSQYKSVKFDLNCFLFLDPNTI